MKGKRLTLTWLTLVLIILFALPAAASAQSRSGYGGHNGYYGHNGFYGHYYPSYAYTYSYPSYYGYGTNYYTPSYQTYCSPNATLTIAPVGQTPAVSAQDNTDKVLKELLLRKLLNEQAGQPAQQAYPPGAAPRPEYAAPGTQLTPEETAQLKEVLRALREKAAPAPEKKE